MHSYRRSQREVGYSRVVDVRSSQGCGREEREMGSPHRSPPRLMDGESKGMKNRLQDINFAMAWIKDELVSERASVGALV